ncbi:MAG: hypothetical protein JWQ81_6124 [Amycolatopsis sp.]|jgi:hypothetical protein|uniref:IniB N-terminal domain-containing protein n=1 Tax=Amycolatopsis sp. TaxID=37632 RepID=UPI00260C4731|nr:IniB N-terminal domain-containing protein [Amycolatopsis sp.]MCU1685385.1 hypothetical protein [Amycolatopsis sp.]
MDPVQTLHDFALNLLNDAAARTAFALDPERALAAAGLGDISAADVHEVVPLVLDYAQVDHLAPLGGELTNGLTDQLTNSLPDVGQAGAIESLKALTQGFGASGAETTVTNTFASVTTLAGGLTGDFSQLGDLTHSLDATPLAGLESSLTGAFGDQHYGTDAPSALSPDSATHLAGDVAGNLTSTLGHAPDLTSAVNGLSSSVGDLTSSLHVGGIDVSHVGGVDVNHLAGDVAGNVSGMTSGIEHSVGDVTAHVGDIADHSGAVTTVHDVASGVGNDIGNVGDIANHADINVLSGNDIHLPFH